MKGRDVGVVESGEYLGRGVERRRRDGETFGRGVGEGVGRRMGKGLRKVKGMVVERLGEGKEGLGKGGWVGWEESLVEVGDRVVVVGRGGVEERDRGMVGEVVEVRKVEGEVVVEGLNLVSLRGFFFWLVTGFFVGRGFGCFVGFLKPSAFNLL